MNSIPELLKDHKDWLSGSLKGRRLGINDDTLRYAVLRNAVLRNADLRNADLSNADLRYAVLRHADLSGADLRDADLGGADLSGANLRHAHLRGAVGNMREIKTAQFDTWPVTWTTSPKGVVTLQIGCQRHELQKWQSADPGWIAAMDPRAAEWWATYGETILKLVELSPAVPWGQPANDTEATASEPAQASQPVA